MSTESGKGAGWKKESTEFWEVLVSAQQIVEIRFVPVVERGAECRNSRDEAVQNQHSRPLSAKNYQTRSEEQFRERRFAPIRLLPWSLVLLAVTALLVWLLCSA